MAHLSGSSTIPSSPPHAAAAVFALVLGSSARMQRSNLRGQVSADGYPMVGVANNNGIILGIFMGLIIGYIMLYFTDLRILLIISVCIT